MKVKITTVEEKEISIDYPCYYKGTGADLFYYKLINELTTLRVEFSMIMLNFTGIQIIPTSVVFELATEPCEPEVFCDALKNAQEKLETLAKL